MKIRITSYEESEKDIKSVRDTVFCREQNVAPELEWDGEDPHCIHAVAEDDDGRPVGTGRMGSDGKIGRFAVLKPFRGRGAGRKMLEALLELARLRGITEVYLHAQTHAVSFYKKNGFVRQGKEFMEASIRHVNMTKKI